ncbi:THAP domain-containing protein 9 [Plakobranchus ocellatus]|uniref:THAP domain-containing protein 9 n=1 Tax=Plakobranchus ocellatus TaxID=259542 RepID=A0AAV4A982_9GAST|nr:THAP domain-containing protein 9 [Plakobranchus ocellatus]
MVGFVDIGNGVFDDSAPPATDALVLMAVAVNSSMKVALGYFLINGLSGTERANIIKTYILKLHDVGVRVISLACDGPSCHFSMLKQLGACLEGNDPNKFETSFPHPASADDRIYVLLDVCHMLKLFRNAFAVCGLFRDRNNQIIRWGYLEDLHKIQEREGLHLQKSFRPDIFVDRAKDESQPCSTDTQLQSC